MVLRRFLLFCGHDYYPQGGWGDFDDSFDTLPEAIANGEDWKGAGSQKWWQVVDTETGEEVEASL